MEYVQIAYWVCMVLVIAGHFAFAYMQAFKWDWLAKRLTNLDGPEIASAAFLGKSIASYNAAVGAGLALSFWLEKALHVPVQAGVLLAIVLTALVGNAGTKGNSILLARLAPAAAALALLILMQIMGDAAASGN